MAVARLPSCRPASRRQRGTDGVATTAWSPGGTRATLPAGVQTTAAGVRDLAFCAMGAALLVGTVRDPRRDTS